MDKIKLRIAHVCLASSYTEGMLYQDNILPDINRKHGHDVLVVSDCTCYVNGKISKSEEIDKTLANGVRLVRLRFAGDFLPELFKNKLRYAPGLAPLLEEFKPDIILYHSLVGLGLLTVGLYKKKYPQTRLYLDSHADFNNSATFFASKWLQYRFFNKSIWRLISKFVDKVFYVSEESRDFLREIYRIDDKRMEFFPLGGFITNDREKKIARRRVREKYSIPQNDIIFLHTGKFNAAKKTVDVLRVFLSISRNNVRLVLAGVFESDIADEVKSLIESDSRINWVGWKSGEELTELMCASDVYLQPGSQSASLQTAICCGLPVLVYPHKSHFSYLHENGFFVNDSCSLKCEIEKIISDTDLIKRMSDNSTVLASKILDYNKIAARIYL